MAIKLVPTENKTYGRFANGIHFYKLILGCSPGVMNVAVAESMNAQQVCKYKGQLDPTMTVVASQHTTCVPYVFPLSLEVTRDTC